MNILLLLSGVILANKEIDKTQLEAITKTNVAEQYKIIPEELINLKRAENIQKQVAAKKKASKKISAKKAKIKSKNAKKVQKSKKYTKKKVVKSKNKKKATYKSYRVRYNVGEIQSYAHSLVLSYGWSEQDYQYLVLLWNRESSWNPNAVNKKSGACGIPQSLPCRKMASEGSDYRTNYKTQVRWGLKYIANRYGNPTNAWKHSQRTGWY